MEFDYYYSAQADQYSFIRIPKIILTEEKFATLSLSAKVLYGVLLDRMSLSRKNGWFDKENKVFIIYQIGEIQENLALTKKKAMDLLSELEKFGLLEKKRRGHGLPNILYVKSFMANFAEGKKTTYGEKMKSSGDDFGTSDGKMPDSRSAQKWTLRSADFGTHEVPDSALQEVPVSAPLKNKTEENKTYRSKVSSHLILSEKKMDGADEIGSGDDLAMKTEAYANLIDQQINYQDPQFYQKYDRDLVKGIRNLILETVLCQEEKILIACNYYPTDLVKSRFLQLNSMHILYVMECLRKNTKKVNNIKKYLLAALFNAPVTMGGYYQMKVQHDMPELAAAN